MKCADLLDHVGEYVVVNLRGMNKHMRNHAWGKVWVDDDRIFVGGAEVKPDAPRWTCGTMISGIVLSADDVEALGYDSTLRSA